MKEARRFVKESIIYTIGEILTKSLAFLLIPIYTRYLTKSDFAIYNLVLTIWPVLLIIYGKGFSSYLIRGYFDLKSASHKKEFFGSILILSVVISLILSVLIHLFGDLIFSPIFKEVSYKPFLQFAVAIAFFKLFINNVLSIYRAERKPLVVVSLSLLNFIISISLIIWLVVILNKQLWGVLWGQFISLMIISLIFFVYIQKDIRYKLRKDYMVAATLFALPLIPHALSGWIVNLSDRIFIERFCTLEDLAVYSLGYQLAMAMDILINSMNQAWLPFFYSNASNPDQTKELKKSTTFFFTAVVAVGLGLSLFSKEIIIIAGRTEYMAASKIFPLIILAFVIHSIYYMSSASLFYQNKTKVIPVISMTAGVVSIGLNIIFIPRFGYMAAAYTTIISFFVMAMMSYLFSRKYFPIPFQFIKLIIIFVIAAIIYFASFQTSNVVLVFQIVFKLIMFLLFPFSLILMKIVRFQDIKNFRTIFFSSKQNDLQEM